MTPLCVVKIDLCNSKKYAAERADENPSIRKAALEKLIEVSKSSFPRTDLRYPNGSYYKSDGDAVFYVHESPSIALRGAVDFMQNWFYKGLPQYPECRVFIDRGPIETAYVAGTVELTGAVFENISVFEKGVSEGQIFLTSEVLLNCDQTMAKFVSVGTFKPRDGETIALYHVDFDDPRTVGDSSLIHALFVAQSQATEARERMFELFIVEYVLEIGPLQSVGHLLAWAKEKGYTVPRAQDIDRILRNCPMFNSTTMDGEVTYSLAEEARLNINASKKEFLEARQECLLDVTKCIIESTKASNAIDGIDLPKLTEEYLCAVFSEVRMVANYFRHSHRIFDSEGGTFRRFEYVVRKFISDVSGRHYEEWRDGFLRGLRAAAEKNNMYVAAVFHNVLATYYLNRSTQTSPYQQQKLIEREIFFDTNVLYSLMVPASRFHEVTKYFATPLSKLGLRFRIFPFTLKEYERSLAHVEKSFQRGTPSPQLIRSNPWLFQEFNSHPAKYLRNISVCRQTFSLAKGVSIEADNFPKINEALESNGLTLETKCETYPEEVVEGVWLEIRSALDNPKKSLTEYWDFVYSEDSKPEEVIRHDVLCIKNVAERHERAGGDDLGPKVLLITTDVRKMLRLREKFPFILSPNQFLEFFLPYLFLADIPLTEAERFPNLLLSAQLGTMLVKKPPEITMLIEAYLKDPAVLEESSESTVPQGQDLAKVLNDQRLNSIVEATRASGGEGGSEVAAQLAGIAEEVIRAEREAYYRNRSNEDEISALKGELEKSKEKIEKLTRTTRYWKQRARH